MTSTAWDGQDQHMASGPDDEFNQFLDMSGMGNLPDNMQFDFNAFSDGSNQPIMAQQRQAQNVMMATSDSSNMIPRSDGFPQNHTPAVVTMSSAPPHNSMTATHMMAPSAPTETISNIDAQIQYLQQQKLQQQQRQFHEQQTAFFSNNHGHSVPPTPQSLEMPASNAQFYSPVDQGNPRSAYERGYHRHNGEQQDMAFTPLVSPAVTPLDPHFNMDNAFTVPGSYFSPLTSPALVPQNDATSAYDHSTNSNNSPIDMDIEVPPTSSLPSSNQDLAKKARKNNAAKARTKSSIKNSPISKPLRRKTGPSPAMVSQVLNEAEERNMQIDSGFLPLPATSTESSEENASVSPENLSDMPPPPVPARRSVTNSPYIQAQNGAVQTASSSAMHDQHQQQQQPHQPHPATPASLMKLPSSRSSTTNLNHLENNTATEHIESLELPESVANKPLAPLNTRISPLSPNLVEHPHSAIRNSMPQQLASSGVRTPGTLSATQSPSLLPRSSGSTAARKTPQLLSRNSRKRSTSSVHVSPALLPRISPNIKPLIPGTPGMSAEDTSRLLMSKSNYQNILEGNNVPGVSYPSELSTNLTSKRTSHKIAEQGRRNRINSALQIMASLLPEGQTGAVSAEETVDDKKDSKQAANAPSSKASVVENAIEHMKHLQAENGALKQELEQLKETLNKLTSDSPSTS